MICIARKEHPYVVITFHVEKISVFWAMRDDATQVIGDKHFGSDEEVDNAVE